MYGKEYTLVKISELKTNEIFVIGCNLTGSHGSGMGRFAYEHIYKGCHRCFALRHNRELQVSKLSN